MDKGAFLLTPSLMDKDVFLLNFTFRPQAIKLDSKGMLQVTLHNHIVNKESVIDSFVSDIIWLQKQFMSDIL